MYKIKDDAGPTIFSFKKLQIVYYQLTVKKSHTKENSFKSSVNISQKVPRPPPPPLKGNQIPSFIMLLTTAKLKLHRSKLM